MKIKLIVMYFWDRALCSLVLLLLGNATFAQLCTGSLGDPVVNITFGSGPGSGPELNAATTSYRFSNTDCPNDGIYAIRSSTSNCYNSWHTVNADHTGNPQGYFMLVNASFEPSDFYVETVRGLCANTTYEFAAWVMNMVRPANQIKPNVTFSIEKTDGTVLSKFNSGDIDITSTPQWKQYGFNFTTPPGTFEVILRMRNNAPGGIGNDIALDDITFRPCGPLLSNVFSGNNDTVDLCEGDTKAFDFSVAIPPFYTNPSYQWQLSTNKGSTWNDITGATDLLLTVNPTAIGSYWYRITVSENENFSTKACRIASNATAINIHPIPVVSAGTDKVVIKGDELILQGKVQGPSFNVNWSPPDFMDDNTKLTPKISPLNDITYTLTAQSELGCSASDTVLIKVVNGIYIPDSFTPNGDGKNDKWRIPFIEYLPDSEVMVFNRYGELVYQAKGGPAEWDGSLKGKLLPSGVYVYLLKLRKDMPPLKGFITLIR